jgi:hypothetical protein
VIGLIVDCFVAVVAVVCQLGVVVDAILASIFILVHTYNYNMGWLYLTSVYFSLYSFT